MPLKNEENNMKNKLHNDILRNYSLNAPKQSLSEYKQMIETVTECLWDINCNENKFTLAAANGHCFKLPVFFLKYTNMNIGTGVSRKRRNHA